MKSLHDLWQIYNGGEEGTMDRCLRRYTRVAQTTHWCDRCCQHIYKGETYEGMVWVHTSSSHRLVVFKFHVDPSCDHPPDPDREKMVTEETEDYAEQKLAA